MEENMDVMRFTRILEVGQKLLEVERQRTTLLQTIDILSEYEDALRKEYEKLLKERYIE